MRRRSEARVAAMEWEASAGSVVMIMPHETQRGGATLQENGAGREKIRADFARAIQRADLKRDRCDELPRHSRLTPRSRRSQRLELELQGLSFALLAAWREEPQALRSRSA